MDRRTTWLNVCATALEAMVVFRSTALFWKKIPRNSPPTKEGSGMLVAINTVRYVMPPPSVFGCARAGKIRSGTASAQGGITTAFARQLAQYP